MKNFLRPTKDKIIFTLVMPSYLFIFYDFSIGEMQWYWLPLPVVVFFGLVIYIMFAGTYNSQINFILQKIQHQQILKNDSVWQSALMWIELAVPFVFNYLVACLFFNWYYSTKKHE
jgi:hypothetical protein